MRPTVEVRTSAHHPDFAQPALHSLFVQLPEMVEETVVIVNAELQPGLAPLLDGRRCHRRIRLFNAVLTQQSTERLFSENVPTSGQKLPQRWNTPGFVHDKQHQLRVAICQKLINAGVPRHLELLFEFRQQFQVHITDSNHFSVLMIVEIPTVHQPHTFAADERTFNHDQTPFCFEKHNQ